MGRRVADEQSGVLEREEDAAAWLRRVESGLLPATDNEVHPVARHMLAGRAAVKKERGRLEAAGLTAVEIVGEVRVLLAAEGLERAAARADAWAERDAADWAAPR